MCLLVQWPFPQHHYSLNSIWEIVKLRWCLRFLSTILIYYSLSRERPTEAGLEPRWAWPLSEVLKERAGQAHSQGYEDTWAWELHCIHLRIIVSTISWLPNVPDSWCPPQPNLGNYIWTEAFRDRTAVADGAVVLSSHWWGTEAVYCPRFGWPSKNDAKAKFSSPALISPYDVGRVILGYRKRSIHKLWPGYYLGPQMDQLSGSCISSYSQQGRRPGMWNRWARKGTRPPGSDSQPWNQLGWRTAAERVALRRLEGKILGSTWWNHLLPI